MRRLKLAEVGRLRFAPGESLGLFITDRCPVGCNHCSVDSRHDSPMIRDWALFEAIVDEMAARPAVRMVGITGGEPFVERRGLALAMDRLTAADKDIILYTSGVWANASIPPWIRAVLRRCSCVFLSTDSFHAASIEDERFIRAARVIAEEGAWIVIQVLNIPEMVERANRLIAGAFGDQSADYVEVHLNEPLPFGRGQAVFGPKRRSPGATLGACAIVAAQLIRYDGVITACCNEQVIMGWGPPRLRRVCTTREEVRDALDRFGGDPLLRAMNTVGLGPLTRLPQFADLAGQQLHGICHACWIMQERALPLGDTSDRLLNAISLMQRTAIDEHAEPQPVATP